LIGRYQRQQWEFKADAIGAAFTSPQQQRTNLQNLPQGYVEPPWTPLSTHPPITDRIAALAKLESTPEGAARLEMLRDTYCR
jgi:Zn-dependent protease with chaperone function